MDFANHEAANGDYWTHPEYRGKSVAFYATQMRQKYLRGIGITHTRGATPFDNKASQKVARLQPVTARSAGLYRRILCWESWKEFQLDATTDKPAK